MPIAAFFNSTINLLQILLSRAETEGAFIDLSEYILDQEQKKEKDGFQKLLLLFIYFVLVERFQLDFGSQCIVLIRHQCMLAVGRLVHCRRATPNMYFHSGAIVFLSASLLIR
jgi:hypothetical protein